MLFTDPFSERVVNALSKVGLRVVKQGKHIGMSDGYHRVTPFLGIKNKSVYS